MLCVVDIFLDLVWFCLDFAYFKIEIWYIFFEIKFLHLQTFLQNIKLILLIIQLLLFCHRLNFRWKHILTILPFSSFNFQQLFLNLFFLFLNFLWRFRIKQKNIFHFFFSCGSSNSSLFNFGFNSTVNLTLI